MKAPKTIFAKKDDPIFRGGVTFSTLASRPSNAPSTIDSVGTNPPRRNPSQPPSKSKKSPRRLS